MKNKHKHSFGFALAIIILTLMAFATVIYVGYCVAEYINLDSANEKETNTAFIADDTQEASFETAENVADDEYFNNTIFVGDSRTVALEQDGYIPTENTFAIEGISHVTYMKTTFTDYKTGTTGLIGDIAAARQPERIYVALGVNGVAFMDTNEFLSTFGEMIDGLISSSPSSKIIIQSILPVANGKNYDNANLNNTTINSMNVELQSLATEKGAVYFDPSSAIKDATGQMALEYDKGDGLHFNQAGYQKIYEYIKNNPVY